MAKRDPVARVLGDKAGPIGAMLDRTHPDLAKYVKEFAYGEVYQRPGLDLKSRELMAITALAMLNLKPQLKTHVYGALHVGLSRKEIEEAFIHLALYAGFPVALSGLLTAQEVFAEIDAKPPSSRRKKPRSV